MVLNERKSSFMQGGRRVSDYREDDVPSQLYEVSPSRLSDVSMFEQSSGTNTRQQRGPFPYRTTFVALLLFIVGLVFLLTAILYFRSNDRDTEIAFIVLGSIAFIPGCYAVFNIIQWYRGVPGFHLSQFAHWDEYET